MLDNLKSWTLTKCFITVLLKMKLNEKTYISEILIYLKGPLITTNYLYEIVLALIFIF